MSASAALCTDALETIESELDLKEVLGESGAPYQTLQSPAFGNVGCVRIFKGSAIEELIYIGLTVPEIHLDSHMLFAFTDDGNAVPHFTLDSVAIPDGYAFHLDLIPRLDLGANLAYMDEAFGPLSPIFDEAEKIEGLTKAQISQRQVALMSPWMLVHRATADAFEAISKPVDAYLAHWLGMVKDGISTSAPQAELGARNAANRSAIFNPDVDPVWKRVEELIGSESTSGLCELLRVGSARLGS